VPHDGKEGGDVCLDKCLGFDPALAGHCKLKVFVAGRWKFQINFAEGLRSVAFHFDVCYKTILPKTFLF
jgi:hypothetical protein